MTNSHSTGSRILDGGRTPEEWSECLSGRGIKVQPDTIRKAANELGARFTVFGSVMITAEQMDQIIEERSKCLSNQNSAGTSGKLMGASNTTAGQSPNTSGSALDHLRKQAQGTGSAHMKKGQSAAT